MWWNCTRTRRKVWPPSQPCQSSCWPTLCSVLASRMSATADWDTQRSSPQRRRARAWPQVHTQAIILTFSGCQSTLNKNVNATCNNLKDLTELQSESGQLKCYTHRCPMVSCHWQGSVWQCRTVAVHPRTATGHPRKDAGHSAIQHMHIHISCHVNQILLPNECISIYWLPSMNGNSVKPLKLHVIFVQVPYILGYLYCCFIK